MAFFEDFRSVPKQNFPIVAQCEQCRLYEGCKNPYMQPSGEGKRGILLVGEAPGKNEDEENIQFIGKAGQKLERSLRRAGVDMRRDCWITNAVICRPPSNKLPERAVDFCRPNVTKAIANLNPEVIITLGAAALRSVLKPLWSDLGEGISQWAGWQIPCQKLNTWICPTYHPSAMNYDPNPVLEMRFDQHIMTACGLSNRPWAKMPKYHVEKMYDRDQIVSAINSYFTHSKTPVAFDYETDRLKPDHPKSRIVCCSLSNGKLTISFPWYDNGIRDAMRRFLLSSTQLIAANLDMEHRWSMAHLGVEPKNWWSDTCLRAHLLDNRTGVTGLKFQSFIRFGIEEYDRSIAPFLEAEHGNDKNRIDEIDIDDLLRYCALDSLFAHKVAMDQAREGGFSYETT